MQKRERILLLVAVAAVLLWLGLPKISGLLFGSIDAGQSRLAAVDEELSLKTKEAARITEAGGMLKQWRSRSLPPNPLDAQRLYQVWLTDLAQMAELGEVKVSPGRRVPKGKIYTGVLVSLEAKATLSRLSRFLYCFYRIDLPHRIVTLTVESSSSRDDPTLTISLMAEGLSFAGVPDRPLLFPQTTLKREFRSQSAPQSIEVAEATGFPEQPGFRVRLGNEYLTVTARSGNQWTVRGGVDGTRADRHGAGELIELAPIHPEYAAHTLDEYRALVENSPFTKPAGRRDPPHPTTPRIQPPPVVRRDTSPEETYLAAAITKDDEPQAWLYRRSNGVQTVLQEGTKLNVGDVSGLVEKIGPDYVLLKTQTGTWRLRLGENLRSMQKVAEPAPAAEVAAPRSEGSALP